MSIETLDKLSSTADDLEARIASEREREPSAETDLLELGSDVTAAKTQLVAARTAAEKCRVASERCLGERRRRAKELKDYQALVLDLEQWVLGAQGQLGAEIKMASVKAVRDNIQVAEVDLKSPLFNFSLTKT